MMETLRSTTRPPWIIAHRGASADFPENSLASFQAAAAMPEVDAIEMDIQLSRDGVPVVFHDESLERIGRGPERLVDRDWDVLRRVGVGAWFDARFYREMLPSLEEVFIAIPGRTLCLELKVYPTTDWDELVRRTVNVIVEQGAEERILLLSFDHRALELVREIYPELRTVGLFRQIPPNPAAVDPFFAVDISIRRATPEFVRQSQQRNRPVIVYTCNTEEDVELARSLGVNAITTDRPAWLAGML